MHAGVTNHIISLILLHVRDTPVAEVDGLTNLLDMLIVFFICEET